MGVLEKVGRSMPRAQSTRGRTLVRQRGGSGGPPPEFFFVLHALRLILMQSRQRNVDEMKYTIANITMNIIVSLLSQVARMSPSSIRRGCMASGTLTLWLNEERGYKRGGARPNLPPRKRKDLKMDAFKNCM